jgi:hypothetical protein
MREQYADLRMVSIGNLPHFLSFFTPELVQVVQRAVQLRRPPLRFEELVHEPVALGNSLVGAL